MKHAHQRRTWLIVVPVSVLACAVTLGACANDDVEIPASPDGSAEPPQDDDGGNEGDATADLDGGSDADALVDGGDNLLPEDPGGTDPDGGFDGGPSCAPLSLNSSVRSTCALPSKKAYGGGDLTSGSFQLTSVTVFGDEPFCAKAFVAYDHRGALEITANSETEATFEFIDQYSQASSIVSPSKTKFTTVRYDVTASATGAKLTYTPLDCAHKDTPKSASYTAGTDEKGRPTLVLQLPYGKTTADYSFVATTK